MQKIKKLLFPFFNQERHAFLTKKWWFRTVVVLYVTGLIIAPLVIFFPDYNIQGRYCRYYQSYKTQVESQSVGQKKSLDEIFAKSWNNKDCREVTKKEVVSNILSATIIPIVLHYVIQLIFFKIVIDYIVLDYSKSKKEEN